MKTFHILLILFLVYFSSCKHEEKMSLLENKYGKQVHLSFQSNQITLDSLSLKSYQIFSNYTESVEDIMLCYNSSTHSLDKFNLHSKTIEHIPLKKEGPDGIARVTGLYVNNIDSIWIYDQGRIYLIDSKATVKQKISPVFKDGSYPMVDTNFSSWTQKIFYHSGRKSIFYTALSIIRKDYHVCKVVEYSLKDGTSRFYNLTGVGYEKKARTDYGWMQLPNVNYTEKDILYNFPFESNVYKINIETKERSSYGGQSKYTSNLVSKLKLPYSFEEGNKHLIENVHFFELIHDPKKDLYYRIHLDGTDYIAGEDFHRLYNSKNMYITVFNSRFEIINETNLPQKQYNYFNNWGILNEGLFVVKDNLLNESNEYETFEFDVFNVD